MTQFDELVLKLAAWIGPDGRYNADCPFCGKEAKQGSVHFSFWEDGWKNKPARYHCFVCGASGFINELYHEVAGQEWTEPKREYVPHEEEKPAWLAEIDSYQKMYESRADRFTLWKQYKPITDAVIMHYHLGVGSFAPYSSQCGHDRLIVPIYNIDNKLCGFRGRAFDCDCKSWLTPSGSEMFLFNWQVLEKVRGQPLFIVENPIDALLLWIYRGIYAIATLGVAMWKDMYSDMVLYSHASKVVVAFDNDRPGNGGGSKGKEIWLRDHKKDIVPNGLKLVNKLQYEGVEAYLFSWGNMPYGYDVGKYIQKEMVNG